MANFYNDKDGAKIKGTSKADQIYNRGGNNVTINAGAGNDSVTVSGGKGNDYVQREWGAGTTYIYTSGNDTIEGFYDMDNLVIAGSWSSQRSGDSTVIINVTGKGSITLTDYYYKVNVVSSVSKAAHYNLNWNDDSNRTFNGTSKDDYLWNSVHLVKFNADAGNDYIDNDGSNSTINGGTGDDFIYNRYNGSNSIIDGGDGNDFISNEWGYSVSIDGGAGADTIDNNTDNVTINAGKGDDHIDNYSGENVKINGGDGNDFITNYGGSKVSISGGDGADTIENREGWSWNEQTQMDEYTVPDNATIDGGKGDDRIYNYGNKASVNGGAGNDYIYNGSKVLFVYSGGNDIIYGFNATSTLKISSGTVSSITSNGSDYFVSVGKNTVTLSGAAQFGKINIVNSKGKAVKFSVDKNFVGTAENDSFTNYLDGAKITAGKGDDYIYNYGAKVSINAGEGSDRIYNFVNQIWNNETGTWETLGSPDNTTIIAGKGNDYISNDGSKVLFVYSGGEDTINGFNETSTLQISSGKISSVTTNGTDYFLKVGENTLRLNGAAELKKVNIVNSKGKAIKFTVGSVSTITNKKNNRTLNGTEDRDKITNSGKKVLINAAAGDDTISNSGSNVSVDGGKGNDEIFNSASQVSMNGGTGDDWIYNNASKVSISAGAGNDNISNDGSNVSISAGADKFFYAKGDGNDIIFGFDDDDTLTLDNLDFKASYKNDAIIFKVSGGSVTLQDFSATAFNVNGDTYQISGSKLVKK